MSKRGAVVVMVALGAVPGGMRVARAGGVDACSVSFGTQGTDKGSVTGVVSSLATAKSGVMTVTIAAAAANTKPKTKTKPKSKTQPTALEFTYMGPAVFAKGDTITAVYSCGGWGHYCDARISDAKGEPLVIAGGLGGNQLALGWTFTPGRLLSSRQDPNQTQKSIEKEQALQMTKPPPASAPGKAKLTPKPLVAELVPTTCTTVVDGAVTWLAVGGARTWEGVRPPEGFDYQFYSLVRKR